MSSSTDPVDASHRSIQDVVENLFHKPDYQNLVDSLCNKLKVKAQALLANGVNVTNLLLLTDLAMREAGKLKNLVGYEKRALVITTIRQLARDTITDIHEETQEVAEKLEQELKDLAQVMDTALDSMVDQLYALAPEAYGQAKKHCSYLTKLNCFSSSD